MMSTKINKTPLQTEKALQKSIRVEELPFKGTGAKAGYTDEASWPCVDHITQSKIHIGMRYKRVTQR